MNESVQKLKELIAKMADQFSIEDVEDVQDMMSVIEHQLTDDGVRYNL